MSFSKCSIRHPMPKPQNADIVEQRNFWKKRDEGTSVATEQKLKVGKAQTLTLMIRKKVNISLNFFLGLVYRLNA